MKIGKLGLVLGFLMGAVIAKMGAMEAAIFDSYENSDGELEENLDNNSLSESDQKMLTDLKTQHEQVLNAKRRENKIDMINLFRETEGNAKAGLALSQFSKGQAHELLTLKLSQDAELERLEKQLRAKREIDGTRAGLKANSNASIMATTRVPSEDALLKNIGDLTKQLHDTAGISHEKSAQIAGKIDSLVADYTQNRLVQQDVRELLVQRHLTIENFTRDDAEKLELRLMNKYNKNPEFSKHYDSLERKLKGLVLELIVTSEQYRASEEEYHQAIDDIYQQWNNLLGIVR